VLGAWRGILGLRLGLPQFARYDLMRLVVENELQRIALDPKHPHRLASEEEPRTLFPDLEFYPSLYDDNDAYFPFPDLRTKDGTSSQN